MFPFSFLITPLSIALSLSTATGVLVHDMRIDKVAATAFAAPALMVGYQAETHLVNFATDLHTHSEGGSLSQAVNDLRAQSPRVQPRNNDEKKYLSQKNVGLGHEPCDSYHLPLS